MKNIFYVLISFLTTWTLPIFAAPMTQEQVYDAAQKWLAQHPDFKGSTLLSGGLVALPGTNKSLNTLYKIEVSPSGYLILNSNDVLPVVQIYSAQGSAPVITTEGDPFKALILSISEENEACCEDALENPNKDLYINNQKSWESILATPALLRLSIPQRTLYAVSSERNYQTNIGPLIRSYWYQNLPLSYFDPVSSGGGEGGGIVIGCTATSVAMVLDSNEWPTYGKGITTFDFFSRSHNAYNRFGMYYADCRAKFNFNDFITSARGGPMYNLIQTSRFGWSIAAALNSNFTDGGTGASCYATEEFTRYTSALRYTGDPMVCGKYWHTLTSGMAVYREDWADYLLASLRDRLPVALTVKYGTMTHAVAADGLREWVDEKGVLKQEISLNYGYGYNFWVDFANVHGRDLETEDEPGHRYINAMVANLRPRPVPLPDPVPRQSNPDTVVTWEIPKHYMETQGDIVKQRVKIITAGSMNGSVTYPLTSANSEVVLDNPDGNDVGYNDGLRFDNYNASQETATFTKGFAVSENSEIIFNLDVQNQVNNRTLRVFVSLDGTNWNALWSEMQNGDPDLTYGSFSSSTKTISLASYAGKTIQFRIQADSQSEWAATPALRISDLSVTGLVSQGAPTFSAEFPAQRYNSMKLSEIPGLTMPTGTESKYYKFRIELYADQKRGAGARWYPTSLEDGADDPSCPDNDTWIETYISNDNPGTLPSLAGVPLKIIATGTEAKETIIPLPADYTYDYTLSVPMAFNVVLEPTPTNTLLKVSVKSDYPLDRASSYRQQNALLTLITTDTDGNKIYTSHALCARPDTYEAWPTDTATAVSAAGRNKSMILRYKGPSRPELSTSREQELAGAFSLLYVEDLEQTEPEWMFCASDGRELFSFGTDALRNIYIDSVINRTQPVLPSGMTFDASGDLSDPSNDWIVESGATMPANQRIYRVTFKSGSTISYVPGAELNVVKGCTFEANVTASISPAVTAPQPFILSETSNTGLPEPSQNHIAVANENKEYILVPDETVHVSYHADVAGSYASWDNVPFEPNDFGAGASFKRVAFTPTASATVPLDNATSLTMYSLTVNAGEPLTFTGNGTITTGSWNLSASGTVTLDCGTGSSPITVGADTILKRSGNGELIINVGKQATLDGIAWEGTITNNGTLVYAGTQTGKTPMTQGAQVIATTMSFGAFDYKGPLLTITGNATCTGALKLTTSSSDLTVDAGTLNVASFQIPTDNLSPTIRVINGGKIIASGDFKAAHFTTSNQPTYEISGEGSLIKANRLMSNTWSNSKDQKISIIDGGTLSIGAGGITRHSHGENSTGYILFMRNGTLTAHADWQVVDTGVTYPATCEIRIAVGSTATLDPNGHTITYNRTIVDDEPETGTGTLVIGKTGGTGTVVLTKDNSAFAGATRVLGGTLKVENVSALGAGSLSLEGGSLNVGEILLARTTLAKNPRGKLVAKIGTGKCQIINVEADFVFPQEGFTVELFDAAGNPLPVDNSKFSIENGILCYDNPAWTGETWGNATASASEKNDFTLSGTPRSVDVSTSGLGWIHAKIEGGKLIVSLDENTTLDERAGTVTALDSNGNIVGGVKVTQSAAGSELYKNWMRRYVPAAGTPNTSPNTSYAADGTSNFMKYALGIDPTKKSGAIFTVEKQSTYGDSFLCLTFPRTANGAALADVEFVAESRIGDATAWSTGSETVEKTDGSIVVKMSIGEEARVFTRLRVTQSETTDVSLPAGAILKRNPHNSTSHFSANLQKPELLETAGTFTDVAGTLEFSNGGEVDFATLINNEKSYLLEVDFAAGTAIFVLNENIWLGGNTEFVEFPAQGSFSFTNPQLSALLEQQGNADGTLTIRIREAWTINEVFGNAFAWGEYSRFKSGNALTGDAFYPIFSDGRSMKLFYNNNEWKSSGRWAAGTDFGKIPLHPNRPVSVKRKTYDWDDIGEYFTGTVLPCTRVIIPLCSKDDMICSGDAFPQGCSGIDFSGCDASSKAQCISAGAWKDATGSDSAEDCIRILRDKIDLEFISFDFAEL